MSKQGTQRRDIKTKSHELQHAQTQNVRIDCTTGRSLLHVGLCLVLLREKGDTEPLGRTTDDVLVDTTSKNTVPPETSLPAQELKNVNCEESVEDLLLPTSSASIDMGSLGFDNTSENKHSIEPGGKRADKRYDFFCEA